MSLNAFESLIGRHFGINVEVTRLAGRKPLRWQVMCHRCLSEFTELHSRLIEAGVSYRCRNDACALNRVVPRPKIEPEQKPAFVPVPVSGPKVSEEYRRYQEQMRLWGQEKHIASWNDFRMLDPDKLRRVMAPVEEAERQRQAEQEWKGIERQFQEEFNRKYGIE